MAEHGTARAGVLDVAYERHRRAGGWPVVLLHGFPYDVRCYDEVVPRLVDAGADVIVPYLRGYGPTAFVDASTLRSGQQAALAHDLFELVDALALDRPIVAGYDWGGRAACLVAALWPKRVGGLVTGNGYNAQDIASAAVTPDRPETEKSLWYQYYLHSERGRAGLSAHRADFAELLWREWSPTWHFSPDEFASTAASFDNEDFVDVVVHSYRHRYGLVPGDPAYEHSESLIAAQPSINVPTVVLDGRDDTVDPPQPEATHASHFTKLLAYQCVPGGHNLPRENPDQFAAAVLTVRDAST